MSAYTAVSKQPYGEFHLCFHHEVLMSFRRNISNLHKVLGNSPPLHHIYCSTNQCLNMQHFESTLSQQRIILHRELPSLCIVITYNNNNNNNNNNNK